MASNTNDFRDVVAVEKLKKAQYASRRELCFFTGHSTWQATAGLTAVAIIFFGELCDA